MVINPLEALSPLDGRYRSKVAPLSLFFSEAALIRYRLRVEVEYFLAICETGIRPLPSLSVAETTFLRNLYLQLSEVGAARVKEIEQTTNHDVKAIEYFLKEQIEASPFPQLHQAAEFIHFGLTSQDINNTATPLMIKDALAGLLSPALHRLLASLQGFASEWRAIPMLARTHGQPASPTSLGKEMQVFVARLHAQLEELDSLPLPGKFGGATGNFNAHFAAYPEVDWNHFADGFVEGRLGLKRSWPTTQIDHYDGLARVFDCLRRINTILTDLCQDIWLYVSQEYFRQQIKAGEVGSSAMPHKVNPIDFENAEGNLGLSTALLEFLSRKLPVSRLQRDLTDSTVLRNVGVALGYHFLAVQSIEKGLGKLLVNTGAIERDLQANWAVLAEAIQTILRREGYPKPYEALRDLTRGNARVDQASLQAFISTLDVSPAVEEELMALRPETYLGDAAQAFPA